MSLNWIWISHSETKRNKAAALSCSFYAIQKLWNSRCSIVKMANQENFTTENISELKQIIEKLTNTVTKQNLVIQNLTDRLEKLENNQITSENNIYELEKRLTAVEWYQNRPFFIFTNIDIPADGNVLAPILQIVNNILQVSLTPDEISIAHPLKMETLRLLLFNYCICKKGT